MLETQTVNDIFRRKRSGHFERGFCRSKIMQEKEKGKVFEEKEIYYFT